MNAYRDSTIDSAAGTSHKKLILLLTAAFILRLIWILCIHNPILIDGPWFQARAIGIANGQGYQVEGTPTAFFPVGYPAMLGALYRIFGAHVFIAKLFNVILSTLICWLGYILASRIYSSKTGVIACGLLAFYPNQIFYTSLVMSEILFTAILLLFLITVTGEPPDNPKSARYFISGLILGIGALVRSVLLSAPIALLLNWVFIHKLSTGTTLRRFLFLLTGVIVVLAPWTVRNFLVMRHPVLVSSNSGVNFWLGHVKGRFEIAPRRLLANAAHRASSPEDEIQSERLAYREAFQYLKKHPFEPLLRFPEKLLRFFYADIDGLLNNSPIATTSSPGQVPEAIKKLPILLPYSLKAGLYALSESYYVFLLVAASLGITRIKNGSKDIYLLSGIILTWIFLHCFVFFTLGRFRFPLAPIIVIFAASSLSRVKMRFLHG